MSFETDFDTAFTILLGKAVGVINTIGPDLTPTPTTTGGTTTPAAAGIEFVIDGGGSAITNGTKGGLITPFPLTITAFELQEMDGTSGSITVTVQAGVPGNSPTFASLGSSLSISGGRHAIDSTLAGWTTDIERGVALRFSVTGASTIQRVTVMLYVRRTDV